jgi:hypothetical protein
VKVFLGRTASEWLIIVEIVAEMRKRTKFNKFDHLPKIVIKKPRRAAHSREEQVCSRQRTVVRSLEFQSRAELISDDIDHVLIAFFRDPGAPDDFKMIQVFVAQMIP